MTDRNKLRDKINGTIHRTFQKLTDKGINLAARVPVYRQILSLTGRDKHKGTPGSLEPVGEPDELVVMDLVIGQVTRWSNGVAEAVGDAYFETPQYEFTKDELECKSLPEGQTLRYEIDGDKYTVINGGIRDVDGLTWRVTLKKVA